MNKSYFILIFLSFIIASNLFSQDRFVPGFKLGVATTQVDGDTYKGYKKAGFIGGVTLTAKINEKWSSQFEIFYIQKGSRHNGNPDENDYSFFLMRLNYIEVPILFQYTQKKFTFDLGPGFAYLISAKEWNELGIMYGNQAFYNYEINGNLGLNYTIIKNLSVSWRFSYSLLPIRQFISGESYWFNPGQKNNLLSFTLTYKLARAKSE